MGSSRSTFFWVISKRSPSKVICDNDEPVHYSKHLNVFHDNLSTSFWEKHKNTLYGNNLQLDSNSQIIVHLDKNHASMKAWYCKSLQQWVSPTRHTHNSPW